MIPRPTLLFVSLLASCGPKAPAPEPAAPAPVDPDAAVRAEAGAAMLAALDRTADPCVDFYRYACGGWVDSTTRPADQAMWARSFSVINERNREIMKALLERAAADPGAGGSPDTAEGGDWRRLGLLYGSCMDEAGVEAAGMAPIQPALDSIEGLKAKADLPRVLAALQAQGLGGAWTVESWADLKDPDVSSAYLGQGGLGLPDRDYYLRTDEASVALQAEYRAFVSELLTLAGADAATAGKQAEAIYALEAKIADFSLPREALRDPNAIYNPRDAAALAKLAPNLGFSTWAQGLGLDMGRPLVLHDEAWYGKLDKLLSTTDPATLRAWLRFHALADAAEFLPDAFGQAAFAFYGQKITGQAVRKDRWKRCVDFANRNLGDALGRHYVAEHFAGDSKQIARDMLGGIKTAFEGNLPSVEWMDDPTRQAAREKAGTLVDKIGYPDTWLDTSTMAIDAQPWGENALAARRFHVARDLAKVGKPVDPAEWYMSAPTVNAYYNPTENEMVFPAGILQPPFFHRAFPAAMNHGAIGMVIGHELTHGFDDEGRKFDKDGKLTEWWAPEVSARFEERAACVGEQFSAFDAVDGLKVNGELTMGENIADLGGLKLAWAAYQAQGGQGTPFLADFTDDQVFFLAFAQGWCRLVSPELEKLLVTTDPHSPSHYRVNGPLQNMPAFHQAFQCKEGQPMVRPDRCEVW